MAIKDTIVTLYKNIETEKTKSDLEKQQPKYLPLIFGDINKKELLGREVIVPLG